VSAQVGDASMTPEHTCVTHPSKSMVAGVDI